MLASSSFVGGFLSRLSVFLSDDKLSQKFGCCICSALFPCFISAPAMCGQNGKSFVPLLIPLLFSPYIPLSQLASKTLAVTPLLFWKKSGSSDSGGFNVWTQLFISAFNTLNQICSNTNEQMKVSKSRGGESDLILAAVSASSRSPYEFSPPPSLSWSYCHYDRIAGVLRELFSGVESSNSLPLIPVTFPTHIAAEHFTCVLATSPSLSPGNGVVLIKSECLRLLSLYIKCVGSAMLLHHTAYMNAFKSAHAWASSNNGATLDLVISTYATYAEYVPVGHLETKIFSSILKSASSQDEYLNAMVRIAVSRIGLYSSSLSSRRLVEQAVVSKRSISAAMTLISSSPPPHVPTLLRLASAHTPSLSGLSQLGLSVRPHAPDWPSLSTCSTTVVSNPVQKVAPLGLWGKRNWEEISDSEIQINAENPGKKGAEKKQKTDSVDVNRFVVENEKEKGEEKEKEEEKEKVQIQANVVDKMEVEGSNNQNYDYDDDDDDDDDDDVGEMAVIVDDPPTDYSSSE